MDSEDLKQSLNVLEMEDDETASAHSFGLVETVVPPASSDPKELVKKLFFNLLPDSSY